MDFTADWFPAWFCRLTIACSLLLVLYLLYSLKSSVEQKKPLLQPWLWSIFLLCILWLMRASLESGINMHLSGAMIMALMFGWRMGLLGMCLVNVSACFFNDVLFMNIGAAILLNAFLPVTLSYFIFLLLEARLPRHFFVYIYGSAFFGTWIVTFMTGLAIALFLKLFEVFEWSLLAGQFLPYYFLLGFSEAFLTAGLITLFVVYRPGWVYSFRDNRYLDGK